MTRIRLLLAGALVALVLPATALAAQTDRWQKQSGKVRISMTRVVGKTAVRAVVKYDCDVDGSSTTLTEELRGKSKGRRIHLENAGVELEGTLGPTFKGTYEIDDESAGCTIDETAVKIKRTRVTGG